MQKIYVLPIHLCNKLFDILFRPILLCSSEVWGSYDKPDFKKWEKDPIERLHTQFYKYYLGLNRRAPNVVSRNEVGIKAFSQVKHLYGNSVILDTS